MAVHGLSGSTHLITVLEEYITNSRQTAVLRTLDILQTLVIINSQCPECLYNWNCDDSE